MRLSYSFFMCFAVMLFCLSLSMPLYAATNAPHTGMEGGQKHSYGPDAETRRQKQLSAGQGMVDAYGNPVIPEEDDESPRSRLRHGAYGGSRKQLDESPLPDPEAETDAGWNF